MPFTTKLRVLYATLFALVVLGAIGGWFAGKDPSQLMPVLATLATAVGIGEASNIGKRATFKKDVAVFHKNGS